MSRIDRHIEILLLENDCVIVPGLGGFVAHHISAKYDEQEGLFLPPYRTLGFNSQLTVNDSLLAQSYVEAYDVSFPEALRQIEEEVESIQRALKEEGIYELNDLGKLIQAGENTIAFEPFEGGILTPRFYALNSFDFALKTQAIEKNAINNENLELATAANKPKAILVNINEQGEKRVSVSLKAIRKVAVAAALVVGAILVALPLHNRKGLTEEPSKSGVFYNLFDSSKAPAKQVKNITPVQPVKATSSTHYWALVLASHVTERNAQAYANNLVKKGFGQTRVYEGTGSIKVLYGSYKGQDEAYNALKSLKDVKYFKDAWVIEIDK